MEIDRSKTAMLGLKMSDVGGALSAMLGGGYVNYFGLDGRSYKVIPQVQQRFRLNTDQLLNYYVRDGERGFRAAVHRCPDHHSTVPQSLNHFQQINDAMIQGVPAPGVALGRRGQVSAGSGRAHDCRPAIRSIMADCRDNMCRSRAGSC